jgi:hypothetical protein
MSATSEQHRANEKERAAIWRAEAGAKARLLDDTSVSFLVDEHDHLGTSLLANEALGDSRMTLLYGLVGAGAAALGLLAEPAGHNDGLWWGAAVAALALSIFGHLTLRRLVKRNRATDDYLAGLARIRAALIYRDPALAHFLIFEPKEHDVVAKYRPRREETWVDRWFGDGGHVETVALLNSALAATLGAAVVEGAADGRWAHAAAVGLAAGLFVGVQVCQLRWVAGRYVMLDRHG